MIDIIKTSEAFAKKEYVKHDERHQWNHVRDVIKIDLKLAGYHPEVDMEILKIAIIFHDISYEKYETYVEKSMKVAKKFLNEQNYPEEKTKKVLQLIISHSSPHMRKLGDAKPIEGKILYDSDKFRLAKTKEGFGKYHNEFYLVETADLLKKTSPELFN